MSLSPSANASRSRRVFLQSTAAAMCSSLWGNAFGSPPIKLPAGPSDRTYRSARSLRDMIRARDVSPVEVIKSCIERIELVDPRINAVTHFPKQRAIAESKAAERRLERGMVDWKATPLWGVPVSIKDMYEVAGMPTTAGARIRKNNVSNTDATAVQRLRDAGAIVIAMTNTPLNHSAFETANKLHGQTNNP